MINLDLRKISICKFTVNKTVCSIPSFELSWIKSWLDLSKEKNGISFQIKIYLCNDSGNKKNRRALAGNALARVQRVHEPTDLWDITFCTRWFWGFYRGSPHFVISQFVIPAISWFSFSENQLKKWTLEKFLRYGFFLYSFLYGF